MSPKIRFIVVGLLLTLVSCRKEVQYPVEPIIQYEDFFIVANENNEDKAILKISFTDGDGDLGLQAGDTLPPYTGEFHYNFFIALFVKDNGAFVPYEFPDTDFTFNARMPFIPVSENSKGITGDVEILLEWWAFEEIFNNDTIYFDMYIVDRALHKSNVVSSPNFIVR